MINKKRFNIQIIIIILVLVTIPFLSLAFSALTTVLNINSDVLVQPPQDPLIGNFNKITNYVGI